MREIKNEVKEMQAKRYFGDGTCSNLCYVSSAPCSSLVIGFWSDGQRLKDSIKMGAEGLRGCIDISLGAEADAVHRSFRLPGICLWRQRIVS